MNEFPLGDIIPQEKQQQLADAPRALLHKNLVYLRDLADKKDLSPNEKQRMAKIMREVLPMLEEAPNLKPNTQAEEKMLNKAYDTSEAFAEEGNTNGYNKQDLDGKFQTIDLEAQKIETAAAESAKTLAELIAEQKRDAAKTSTKIEEFTDVHAKLQERYTAERASAKMSPEQLFTMDDNQDQEIVIQQSAQEILDLGQETRENDSEKSTAAIFNFDELEDSKTKEKPQGDIFSFDDL